MDQSDRYRNLLMSSVTAPNLRLLSPGTVDALIDEIPILRLFRKTQRSIEDLQSNLFVKKLLNFLCGFKDVPHEERAQAVDQLTSDSSRAANCGERILLLLSQVDDMLKAQMMGRTFRAFLRNVIKLSDLEAMHAAINQTICRAAFELSACPETKLDRSYVTARPDFAAHLTSTEIYEQAFSGLQTSDGHIDPKGGRLTYSLSKLGEKLSNHVFCENHYVSAPYDGAAIRAKTWWRPDDSYSIHLSFDYGVGVMAGWWTESSSQVGWHKGNSGSYTGMPAGQDPDQLEPGDKVACFSSREEALEFIESSLSKDSKQPVSK